MLAVSCFHRAEDMHGGDVRAGKRTIVHHLFDACAAGGNLRGQICQSARPIADDGDETGQPAIGDKSAFDDPAQDIGINVSATMEEDDAFAGKASEVAGQAGGQRSGSRSFHHAFLQLHYAQDGERDLFLADE